MRTRVTVVCICLIVSAFFTTSYAGTVDSPAERSHVKQVVVRVHRGPKGLDYVLELSRLDKNDSYYSLEPHHLKKNDANYVLAELKLRDCEYCQIIVIVDDTVELSAITQVSEMAINAGFKDIRPFVYWHKTGNMAQIEFGPAIKFTENPEKIAQREKSR